MSDHPSILVLVALASLVSEFVDSALGMGYGTTLAPVLLLLGFEPLHIVPAILASECVTGIVAASLHHTVGNVHFGRRNRASKSALLLAAFGIIGTLVAVRLAIELPRTVVGAYIGVMVTGTGILILATRHRTIRFSWPKLAALGAVAAFNKGIGAGGYGTLITGGQVLSGLDAKQAIGITSLSEGFVSLLGLVLYFLLAGPIDWNLTGALLGGAIASTPLAALTVRRLHFVHLRSAVGVMACVLGSVTLTQFALRLGPVFAMFAR